MADTSNCWINFCEVIIIIIIIIIIITSIFIMIIREVQKWAAGWFLL